MSNREIVERLRAYLEELFEAARKDQSDVRKVSTVAEDIEGILEGEF